MSKSTIHLIVDSGPKQGETLDRKPGTLIRIGRVVKGNTLAIKDLSISQKHLTIEFDAQIFKWVLRDLDTFNGTFVNGDRVPSSAAFQLCDGDTVKIGECTSISIRVSVIDENLGGGKRNGRKRGRGRSKKEDDDDDCKEIGNRNCENFLMNDDILDRSEDLKLERKRGTKSSKGEILNSASDDVVEVKNLRKGRRTNPVRVLKDDKSAGTGNGDMIEVQENFGKSIKAEKDYGSRIQNCESVKDDHLDSVVEDVAKEMPKNLRKERKRNPIRGSKKDRVLESNSGNRIEVVENSGRLEGNSNKDEVTEIVVGERMKAPGNLGRVRRGKTVKVSTPDIVEDSINVPKNLGRGRRTTSTQILEKDRILNSVAVDKTEQQKNLCKRRGQNSVSVSIDNKNPEPVAESSIKSPTDLRGESSSLVLVSSKDEALEDYIEEPKAMVRQRMTRSTKVVEKDGILNLVAEDKIQLPKNEARGRRTSSSRVSTLDETLDPVKEELAEVPKKLAQGKRRADANVLKIDDRSEVVVQGADEGAKNVDRGKLKNVVSRGRSTYFSTVSTLDDTLDPVMEDVIELPKKLGRGKRRANSKVSKFDDISEVVVHDAVEAATTVGRGIPERAPARRTRASSRVLNEEKVLQPAQDPVPKIGCSHQLNVPDKIQFNSNEEKSENMEDKENYVSVKCQKTEIRRHLLKVWNGNGIPNTTTKYMENQKVSWHATPFEERLEKALSDDKLFPQRVMM